jgi:hypothetical protein
MTYLKAAEALLRPSSGTSVVQPSVPAFHGFTPNEWFPPFRCAIVGLLFDSQAETRYSLGFEEQALITLTGSMPFGAGEIRRRGLWV